MSLIFIVSTLKFDLLKPAVDRDIPSLIQKNIQVLHWFSTLVLWCSCWYNRMTISKLFNTWLVHYHPLVVTSTFFLLFAIEFCMLRIMNRNSGKYAVELYQICINSFYTVPCGLTKYVRMKLLINALD